jgi:biopolymer transport protein ExbD
MAEINTSGNKKGKGRSKKASTKVDMTPMVDLAFLLITFFMLTTTFGKPQAMQVNMPDKTDNNDIAPVPASKAFTIILAEGDKVFYYSGYNASEAEETDYSSNGIRKVVMDKIESINDLIIVIKPSAKSRYKNLVDILDEMDITGAKRYAIVDISPEDLALIK